MQVILVLANKSLQRINLAAKKPEADAAIETLDFGPVTPNLKVSMVSLDPLGTHLIISLKSQTPEGVPELLYLNKRTKKFRSSNKVRGQLVTAVAWCARNVSETMTGPILMGTSLGVVYETEFDSGEEKMFASSLERHWRPLVNLGKGQHMPITGLAYYNVEGR